jgi:glycosyltransferase involved in cell wall biosynthesis
MKNQTPLLSIILPTFNRGKYILDAVESIQAMSFRNWELIIIDDGSTDQTNIVISKCLIDERIHYSYNETNQGASFARNLGLQKSKGKYISYLDSDNTYTSSFMSHAIEFLEKNQNLDLVYGALFTSSHGKKNEILFKEFSRRQLLKGNYIDMSTIVHRRKLYELFGGFDESINRLDDWDLILKYTQNNDAKGLDICSS